MKKLAWMLVFAALLLGCGGGLEYATEEEGVMDDAEVEVEGAELTE